VDENSSNITYFDPNQTLIIPAFGKSTALHLDMGRIREAESRIIEAKMVNPSTYADLESSYNEAYRDLKRHLSAIQYQLAMADKILEEAKAEVLLDKYPTFMKGKPKSHDSADLRKAFLIRDAGYVAALDRIAQLKALESNFDGKIKVLENVCRYMRKRMDLIIKSGLSSTDYYVTSGKK
jgi:hypothetical protein